jgi:rhodanese-related sulfurtransferase
MEVAKFLKQNGFRAVNLAGGIMAWSRDVDATIPTY